MFFVSKKKYNKVMNKQTALCNLEEKLLNVFFKTTERYAILHDKYDDIEAEVGLIVGSGHPYYEEIKELVIKGVKK